MIDNFDIKLVSSDGTETTLTSEDVVQVDSASFTDITQTGELHLKLNCEHGKFLTSAPLLEDWMKIKMMFKDQFGNTQSRIYEVQSYIESADDNSVSVTVIALSREYHLTQINFGQQFYQGNAYDVVKELINEYNTNKGPLQVTIDKHNDQAFNQLPQTNLYNYQFTTNEIPYKDGLMVVMNTTNLPIGAGGYGDYFALVFEDDPADDSKMIFKAFVSGSIPTPIPVFEQSSQRPIQSVVTRKEVPDATVVHVKAHPQAGTLPIDLSVFQGILEQFNLLPDYIANREYKKGERVKYIDKRYEARIDTTDNPLLTTSWKVIEAKDVLGSRQYSPWTADKEAVFRCAMANPTGTHDKDPTINTNDYPDDSFVQCWDANMTIRTPRLWRDWCDVKYQSPNNIPTAWERDGQFYRTFRCLCVGSCELFGYSGISDAIMQYDGNKWQIYRELTLANTEGPDGITRTGGDEIAVISEGIVYATVLDSFNQKTISEGTEARDCFHPMMFTENTLGVNSDIPSASGTYGDNSAVSIWSKYDISLTAPSEASRFFGVGWCAPLFRAPYPNNTLNSIDEETGDLYKQETLRLENMSYTHSGKTSFIHKESEDLLVIQALEFAFNFEVWAYSIFPPTGIWRRLNMGDIKFAAFVYDSNGNTTKVPITLPVTNSWLTISVPLPPPIWRPTDPIRSWSNTEVFEKDAEQLQYFETRNVKMIGLQLEEMYDTHGRYHYRQLGFEPLNSFQYSQLYNVFGVNPADPIYPRLGDKIALKGSIDALRFTKQLMVITNKSTQRLIQGRAVKEPSIINYPQAQAYADAQHDIVTFPYHEYTITMQGRCDLSVGQSIYYRNPDIVREGDSGDNTVKLMVIKIIHSYNSGGNGKGFQTDLIAIKRIPT